MSAMPVEMPPPPRVLVVEDEEKTRDSLAEGLRLETWNVETAATRQEALGSIERRAFDLVVLDWMLPDHDGLEILRELRQRDRQTPVLMLTARNTLNDRVAGLDN